MRALALALVLAYASVARGDTSGTNQAVFLKNGDHIVLPPATMGAGGFTLEAWLFVNQEASSMTILDFGGGFFHPRIALKLTDGRVELIVDNRPSKEERGTLKTIDAFAVVSFHATWHRAERHWPVQNNAGRVTGV
jgi:hypothetical protein